MLLNVMGVIYTPFLFFQFFVGLILILLLQVVAGILGATNKSKVCTRMILNNLGKV